MIHPDNIKAISNALKQPATTEYLFLGIGNGTLFYQHSDNIEEISQNIGIAMADDNKFKKIILDAISLYNDYERQIASEN